ncbi:UBX domain-containing protein 4 [Venturia canescens]|uniref:UBX domain-containing protein 4 n=1 Tax=Venturia canescens TaxID=32260 RepID=UPI001C9C0FB1|nr:UBX domain-containing protein 4 [Venturia canescens]
MKWFPGSISEAVTAAKQRGAIFVVFVEGKDEKSVQAARVLDEQAISLRMERDNFVSVKVEADTEAFVFFQQIYEKVSVPSLYFIGDNGVPVFTLVGGLDPAELTAKLDSHFPEVAKSAAGASSSFIQSEQSADSSASAQPQSPEASTMKSNSSSEAPKERELTAEEKIERAKKIVELQRQQKIAEEREAEKQREIERRLLGKDLQALKQKQHEAEIKLALDERMREKAAEAEAREKVLKQIAQDKLERKQREMALQQQTAQQQRQNQDDRSEAIASGSSSSDSTTARIQFRLPSGAPHLGKFEATSTLGSLRSYVARNIELPFQQFTMSTTFPRRDLVVKDDDKTLMELELVPTAVILILPVKSSKVTSVVSSDGDAGFVSRFIWALFAPIMSIYNFVMGYFSGAPRNPPDSRSDVNPGGRGASPNAERFGRVPDQPGSINGNILGGPSTTIRSRGNIHRLHSGGDDNDENNTWNGNSTQQM